MLILEKENDEVIIGNRIHNFECLLVDAEFSINDESCKTQQAITMDHCIISLNLNNGDTCMFDDLDETNNAIHNVIFN